MDCFRPSTPTGAAITSTPPRPGSRWTRPASPRWVGRSSSSASSTSRATARRAGGAWSGCSARSRAGCRRSCVRRGSPRSRLPTTGSPPSTSHNTTLVSRSRLPRKGRRSCPLWACSTTSYASRQSAWWGTTTRSVTRAVCCKSPSSATAATSSRRPCAFTNPRTAGSRSSTVRCGSPTISRTEPWLPRSVRPEPLRKSASQQPYGRRGRALLAHPAHRASAPERTFDVLRRPDIFTCYRHLDQPTVDLAPQNSRPPRGDRDGPPLADVDHDLINQGLLVQLFLAEHSVDVTGGVGHLQGVGSNECAIELHREAVLPHVGAHERDDIRLPLRGLAIGIREGRPRRVEGGPLGLGVRPEVLPLEPLKSGLNQNKFLV